MQPLRPPRELSNPPTWRRLLSSPWPPLTLPCFHPAVSSDLVSMVTGLSSPAFHTTLASPHKSGGRSRRPTAAAAGGHSPSTAAATAAFILSMSIRPVDPSSPGLTGLDGNGGGCHGLRCLHVTAGTATDTLDSCTALDPSLCCSSWGCGPVTLPGAQVTWDLELCGPGPCRGSQERRALVSSKRGLYEGTVRGGRVRNTWFYLTVRNQAR